jgi:hypothetical protein
MEFEDAEQADLLHELWDNPENRHGPSLPVLADTFPIWDAE